MSQDSYTFTVKFERYLSEDEELAQESFPELAPVESLRRQFIKELQAAYDNEGMSGRFVVLDGPNLGDELPEEKKPEPELREYVVTGCLVYRDGFHGTVKARSEAEAREIARKRVEEGARFRLLDTDGAPMGPDEIDVQGVDVVGEGMKEAAAL
jgi:hypothetical protein